MSQIDKIYQEELRKILRRRLRGIMWPTENVLYFKNNIDVRLCPKNGISSLKMFKVLVDGANLGKTLRDRQYATKIHRMEEIKKYGYQPDLPFRRNSYRVTVSRDPIKRFLSACEYLKDEYNRQRNLTGKDDLNEEELYRLHKLSDAQRLPENIDDVINGVWDGEIQNSHFYTQTYYLGNRGQYHQIYPMNRFGDILVFLKYHNEYTGTESLTKVRNKSSYTNYPSVEQLTGGQKKRIMRIYEEDYDYGWTEN